VKLLVVGVQGDVVDEVIGLFEDGRLPAAEGGMDCPELPQATNCTEGSIWRIARAVSAARRPYS